eukprot:GHRQ01013972.1.p1 GENE.GHRQ01013972.1~~GHRQ01013972.1.p1  ORF type:complete len:221 (+),score=21.04 GHRQ01013972.1:99-665(+)
MPALKPQAMHQLSHVHTVALACPRVAKLACRLRHSSRPVLCRGFPGFGSSGLSKATSSDWQVPSILLPSSSPGSSEGLRSSSTDGTSSSSSKSTVYTVRLTTSWDRGAALSEPMAGINICLISKSGRAVLHRISPLNDPRDNLKVMQHICSVSELSELLTAVLQTPGHSCIRVHYLLVTARCNILSSQ